ncbi:D-arabinitol dehydrogenase (NADP+) [Amycolatopsis sacchari]|uniref:D-arabinitol dehydrogenase (NADP+) n=1 Tax=Amycolatopsis sacchari TaxID=115433 RepID=A0A1I3Q625_9PSEU|nr:zinc-dependent alcohol dehydrogenase family protein [Amycolatopsis sacchari]SFJ29125.1 D-arabinitol dehydrogenase (NADP+) [Amycolatopsis sacchari]
MKAVVYDAPRSYRVTSVPDPEPGPDEVLLRVLMAGLCGTDLHLHEGEFGPRYPLTPGHEIVGEVVRTGEAVTGLRPGQRVVLDNTSRCGDCAPCRRGMGHFCANLRAQGVTEPGGFAEYLTAREANCFAADDLPVEVAVFAEPLACVVRGLDRIALSPASDVVIFGAGPTGLLLAQLAAHSGAGRVTVAAPTPSKLAKAAEFGVDHTMRLDRADPSSGIAALRSLAPDGFDVVIDATGAVSVLASAFGLARDGGTIVVYGMAPESARWPVPAYEVFRRELTILGSFAQLHGIEPALRLLRTGRVRTDGLITHRFALDEYPQALAAAGESGCLKAVLVP